MSGALLELISKVVQDAFLTTDLNTSTSFLLKPFWFGL